MKLYVAALLLLFFSHPTPAPASEDWPQWRGEFRDATWTADVSPESLQGRVRQIWTAEIGAGYTGPTVSGDRVYLMDRVDDPETRERIHCFERASGQLMWTHRYPCSFQVSYPLGPRAAVTIHDGKAIALGAMGHLNCLDARSGKVLWSHDLAADFQVDLPQWGISAAPLADAENGQVILHVGGRPDACLVALDLESGKEKWRALSGKASYSAPRFIDQGGKRVVLVWTGDWIAGIDPAGGKVIWQEPFKKAKMVIAVPDPVLDESGEKFFLSSFYDGSYAYRLKSDGVEKIWARRGINERKSDALHSMIMTSTIRDGHVYGIDSYGEFRCLDLETGDRVWTDETLLPKERWATAYFVQNGDVTWMTTETGKLVTGRLSPKGFEKISEVQLMEPTAKTGRGERRVLWSHPAFAGRQLFWRNDRELVCFLIN